MTLIHDCCPNFCLNFICPDLRMLWNISSSYACCLRPDGYKRQAKRSQLKSARMRAVFRAARSDITTSSWRGGRQADEAISSNIAEIASPPIGRLAMTVLIYISLSNRSNPFFVRLASSARASSSIALKLKQDLPCMRFFKPGEMSTSNSGHIYTGIR